MLKAGTYEKTSCSMRIARSFTRRTLHGSALNTCNLPKAHLLDQICDKVGKIGMTKNTRYDVIVIGSGFGGSGIVNKSEKPKNETSKLLPYTAGHRSAGCSPIQRLPD